MATALDYPPIPGAWVERAQDALDALSALSTIDQVADTFGSVRTLVGSILGTPSAGGAGTRRAIRACGHLLSHRLGPALAAEALSWAASVAEVVSVTGIEEFLEAALDSEIARRPLRLEDRDVLQEHLERHRSDAQRRGELRWWWQSRTDDLFLPSSTEAGYGTMDYYSLDRIEDPSCWNLAAPPCTNPAHPLCWIETEAGPAPGGSVSPTSTEVFATDAEAEQLAVFEQLSPVEEASVASDPRLFELAEAIVAHCLLHQTARLLTNPACPDELRSRVRHPYDVATLELALRAGAPHVELARVRRLIRDIDEHTHRHLLATVRLPYLEARRSCGLNTLDALSTGRLAGLDLADRAKAEAALGSPHTWDRRCLPDHVVEILLHHAQAGALAWMLTDGSPVVSAEVALRLARDAGPEIACAAMRHVVPVEVLEARDAPAALACGDAWAARCPGIPAVERPLMHLPRRYACVAAQIPWADDDIEDPTAMRAGDVRFGYPEVIEGLQRPYPQAPGWTVWLPESKAELEANADLMRNCTRMYASSISAWQCFILIVEAPEGHRYNVSVRRAPSPNGPHYRVEEVNSRANQGDRPSWIAPALDARLAAGLRSLDPAEPRERHRRSSTRRRRGKRSAPASRHSARERGG